MKFREQIIQIIQHCILSVDIPDYKETMEQIVFNFLNDIELSKLIEDYVPMLYIQEKDLKIIIEKCLVQLGIYYEIQEDAQVVHVSSSSYPVDGLQLFSFTPIPTECVELRKKEEIDRFLEISVKIMLRKQENKYICTKFSTCNTPTSSEINEQDIENIEKFIQKDIFNVLIISGINKTKLVYSFNSYQIEDGFELYNEMSEKEGPIFQHFVYSYHNLYSLYKSRKGKIYIMHSLNNYIISYIILEDDTWFRNRCI
jgi:hypothetical protein